MRGWRVLPIAILAGSVILSLSCGEESSVGPGDEHNEIKMELEHFTASHDVPGSNVIRYSLCSSASGQRAVKGMDRSGEWIEVPFEVLVSGKYKAYVGYSANENDVIGVTVSIGGCVSPNEKATVLLADGTGMA